MYIYNKYAFEPYMSVKNHLLHVSSVEEIVRCRKKCKKSTEESQTLTECPAVFPAGPSLYEFKNMREKLGQKNHNRIRMGAGNK